MGVASTSSKLQMCRSMDECLAHSCQRKERETQRSLVFRPKDWPRKGAKDLPVHLSCLEGR